MTPEELEIAFDSTIRFLSTQIEYSRQNNLEVYPASYICKNRDHLISGAMLGDPYFRDILCDFASALTTYGKPLPLWLQKYVVCTARNEKGTPRKRGRDSYASYHRNSTIANAVSALVDDYAIRPTRNSATTTECGCSIVAKALGRIGIHMSEANVVAIWRNDRRFVQANSFEPEEQTEGRQATREADAGCHCTLYDCGNLKHFGPDFDDRIASLGRVAMVSRTRTGAIDLGELVDTEVKFCSRNIDERITAAGPPVCMHVNAAETLALALHELTTNTFLFGALANLQGRLDVKWVTTGGTLVLEWEESGAENSGWPRWCGYSRELIDFALPFALGARTRLESTRHGMYCRIELSDYESSCPVHG